jgi:general secretion pathway protein J
MNMRNQMGFTLLEMMVAIGIFAVIATISYGTLNRFIDNRVLVEQKNDELKNLQNVMMLLERDLRYALVRPVRDGFGDKEAALVSGTDSDLGPGELLRLTSAQPNPAMNNIQRLQRVAWRFNDGQLSRITWRVLDRDQDSTEYERILLEDLSEVVISFWGYNEDDVLEVQPEWLDSEKMPEGIEFLVTLNSGRQYRRLLELTTGA